MCFQDKYLRCSECGATFVYSSEEQEIFHSNGFTGKPKRCPSCHTASKIKRYGDGDYSYRSRSWQETSCLNHYQLLDDPNSN
jgi:hypothetical protein